MEILIFGWVVKISLGGCFLWRTLYMCIIGLYNTQIEKLYKHRDSFADVGEVG